MDKSIKLQDFLLKHLENLETSGGTGSKPDLPDFELYAFDYLEFAEKKLSNIENNKEDVDEFINCIAHLKRAIDCQLDTFFYSCNLFDIISKRNLKFEKKLGFLKSIGVFSSRSLNRLNTFRNKMEHHYEVPKINDIEVYYDLAAAFISILQNVILVLSLNSTIEFSVNINGQFEGTYTSKYNKEKHEVEVIWWIDEESKQSLKVTFQERDEFSYFLRTHILLNQIETFNNLEHLKSKLKIIQNE